MKLIKNHSRISFDGLYNTTTLGGYASKTDRVRMEATDRFVFRNVIIK